VGIVLYQDLQDELAHATRNPDVTLHHIVIRGVPQASDFDFDHGAEMVEVGYERVKSYLDRQAGEAVEFGLVGPASEEPAPPPPGARLWVPPARKKLP
jgi:hypothetical protein